MVRVTIEIVPFGDEEKRRTIGRMIVGLQRVSAENYGDYVVKVETERFNGGNPALFLTEEFEVTGHHRPAGVFELLRRCFTLAVSSTTTDNEKG